MFSTGLGFFLPFTGWCDLFARFDKIDKPVIPVVRDRNYGIGFLGDRIAGVRPDGRTGCLPYGNPYGVAPPQYAERKAVFSIVQTGGLFSSVKVEPGASSRVTLI